MPTVSPLQPFFAFGVGWTEIVVISLVVLLLFGGSQLPKLAKSVGQSIVEFKKGVRQLDNDDDDDDSTKKKDPKQLKSD